jgi:glycosyltransferase involved in cell wall biosynthesis
MVPRRHTSIREDIFDYYHIEPTFSVFRLWTIDLWPARRIGFVLQGIVFGVCAAIMLMRRPHARIIGRDAWLLVFPALLGRKVVWEVHAPRASIWMRFVARRAQIVTITHTLQKWLVEQGVDPKRITVLHDGVDADAFVHLPTTHDARRELGFSSQEKITVYTGHLYEWKGIDVVIAAARVLPQVRFLIVGGTSRDIERVRQKTTTIPNITVVGHVPHAQVLRYVRAGNVALLPTIDAHTGTEHTSPLKLFEYMAAEIPIVASALPAITEVVDDTLATLVTPGNPGALAEGIIQILAKPGAAQARAKRAREVVYERYTWHNRAKAIAARIT